jgi:hypothetical protein
LRWNLVHVDEKKQKRISACFLVVKYDDDDDDCYSVNQRMVDRSHEIDTSVLDVLELYKDLMGRV